MAQEIEQLPTNCETLSSTLSATEKKKNCHADLFW
jgi:hypothetical protein